MLFAYSFMQKIKLMYIGYGELQLYYVIHTIRLCRSQTCVVVANFKG